MSDNRTLRWFLYGYLAVVFIFIFAPILFSVIFSRSIRTGFRQSRSAVSR